MALCVRVFLLALTILPPKVFAQTAFDESATLTAVILVCCVIALAIGIIWIFFCYCICKTNRDYQTARMRIEQNAALSRRMQQERARRQQRHAQARRKYRQLTSPQEPPGREAPRTPRLDHPRFQPTFLREIARTPSMELLQGEGRQMASPPAPSAPRSPHVTFSNENSAPRDGSHSTFTLQGGQRIPHSRSFDLSQRSPNVHQSSSDYHLCTPPLVVHPLTVPQSQPARIQLQEHHQVQQRGLQQAVTSQPRAPSPTSGYRIGQKTEFLRPPAAPPMGDYPVGHRLRSVHEFEEMDVWPDSEEPPRYSRLFGEHESSHQQQQRGKGRPGNGYHPGSGIPSRQPYTPQAMPFQFSVQPPTHSSGTRDQPTHRPKQSPWSWNRPPDSHKKDMTQFSQLTSWPQFN